MEILFKQALPWGCGHLSLANFFNEKGYVEDIKPNTPSFERDLQKSIATYSPGLWLSVVVCLSSVLKVQNRFIDISFFEIDREKLAGLLETHFIPFFISVKFPSLHHLILVCLCLKDENLYVFDSLREEPLKLTKEEFVLKYYVVQIYILENEDILKSHLPGNEPETLFFDYDYFPHLKPNE